MEQGGEQSIIVAISVVVFICFFTVTLFILFIRRKNTLIKNKEDTEKRYKQEISKTQIEIREETLRNISWELHDNIGQLITLAKIQVQNAKGDSAKTDEAADTIAKALKELRALSKSINPNTIKNLNVTEAIQFELQRFERLNFLNTEFHVLGVEKEFNINANIILFRILQEFFSNTIKHSQASKLTVIMRFLNDKLVIETKDDGRGYNDNDIGKGQGLNNMKNRAELIKASFVLHSQPGKGTQLKVEYPYD